MEQRSTGRSTVEADRRQLKLVARIGEMLRRYRANDARRREFVETIDREHNVRVQRKTRRIKVRAPMTEAPVGARPIEHPIAGVASCEVGLFGMMRATDLPEWFRGQTWTEPDLIIRTRDGKIHPEYSAVKLAIGFPP